MSYYCPSVLKYYSFVSDKTVSHHLGSLSVETNLYLNSQKLNNNGLISTDENLFMPNLKEYTGSGELKAKKAFIHEDIVDEVPQKGFEKVIVIPHHDDIWKVADCDLYYNLWSDGEITEL